MKNLISSLVGFYKDVLEDAFLKSNFFLKKFFAITSLFLIIPLAAIFMFAIWGFIFYMIPKIMCLILFIIVIIGLATCLVDRYFKNTKN